MKTNHQNNKMYQKLKNITIGFAISFVGSIPLGYLNIIGLEYFKKNNLTPTLFYLLGIVMIESLIIYYTAKSISKIKLNPKLKIKISLFSILFLLLLSYLAKQPSTPQASNQYTSIITYLINYPFITGIVLSTLNFTQIPFWFSWNLYLINENYISSQQKNLILYTFGASVGTFTGMFTLIVCLNKTINYKLFPFQNYIPIIFISLAIWQSLILIRNIKTIKN
ncbi:hypothetical protein V3Q90_13090 [Flavobacterium oreochromis]|uniref:hypothetical protein n=1 Tax=Flavobacterium oreochromis TaxID=2906078 RepID=UPI000F4F4E94|nr:hypothetical protein [Flavobacterium oreochromis]QYS86038.1 hypothetical protein JJC03_13600 [Flavobacterium oreochromis]